jgi:hypothetical protein
MVSHEKDRKELELSETDCSQAVVLDFELYETRSIEPVSGSYFPTGLF